MYLSRSIQDPEIDGHSPGRCRKTVDSGIHEHKTKLRVGSRAECPSGCC